MIVKAFLFGLFLAVAVGPVAVLIVTYSMRFGMAAGVRSALGAATGDLLYAVLAISAGAAIVPLLARHREALAFAAALVLIGFGLLMLSRAIRAPAAVSDASVPISTGRPFVATFILTTANPLTVVAFAGFTSQLEPVPAPTIAIGVVLALFAASLSVQLVLALGGAAVGQVVNSPVWMQGLNLLGALGVTGYGVASLFDV